MHMVLIWVGSPYLSSPPPEVYGGGRYVGAWVGGMGMIGGALRADLTSAKKEGVPWPLTWRESALAPTSSF